VHGATMIKNNLYCENVWMRYDFGKIVATSK